MVREKEEKKHYRALFISDVHLGTKISQGRRLLDFLKTVETDRIYLLGDIIDVSAMKRKFFWNDDHNALLRRLFKLVKHGVKVVYVPGNHDRELRAMDGLDFSGIEIRNEFIHTTHDGKRLLLLHGDKFDGILNEKLMFLYTLGDRCYEFALVLGKGINRITRIFGCDWSLSRYLKTKVKNVVKFINDFECLIIAEAKQRHVDGIICGHIHTFELREVNGCLYGNCGCWTENASALAETESGELELINLNEGIVRKAVNSPRANILAPESDSVHWNSYIDCYLSAAQYMAGADSIY